MSPTLQAQPEVLAGRPAAAEKPSFRRAPQDDVPEELAIARYLLDEHPHGINFDLVYQLPPAIRHYLSRMNVGDATWIGTPLVSGIHEFETTLFPHHFTPRDREYFREHFPNPDESLESRRGIALEFLAEAADELRDFLCENDLQNNRLISAVAGAIRGELRRIVDFIDAGCPAEPEDDDKPDPPKAERKPQPSLNQELENPANYAADIANQLALAAKSARRSSKKSAALLEQILDLNGYRIQEAELGLDCSYVVDFERKVVSLAPRLGKEHRFLKLARCVAAIRLNDVNAELDGPESARRADLYTRLLLMPEAEVQEYLENLTGVYNRYQMLLAVAAKFSVPKHIANARLQELKERAA